MPHYLSFKRIFQTLETAVGISHRRHQLIAGNLSNMHTPGYKARDIDFQKTLQNAMSGNGMPALRKTDKDHIDVAAGDGRTMDVMQESRRWNGVNGVNVDKEIARLTENDLLYRAATEALQRKVALLQHVIKEGGR